MPKRRTFGHFLMSSEDQLFFAEKEDMSSKKRTYGKPKQQLQVASNKVFRKALDRWSVFFLSVNHKPFCLQLKLIRLKLNRSESPLKNDICFIFVTLTF